MTGDFEDCYRDFGPQIQRLAYRQHVPGMEPEDVSSEMTIVLWKAFVTYQDGATTFGSYWWSMWLNRRSDLAGTYYARKRVHPIPVSQVPERVYEAPGALLPPPTTPMGRLVWRMLADGERGGDVRDMTHLSRRGYYDLIRSWRSDDVRSMLRSD